jgi:hypothetical protein
MEQAETITRGRFAKRAAIAAAGVGTVLAVSQDTAQAATDPELDAHIQATTDVHGIPDTSVLAKYTSPGTFSRAVRFESPSTNTVPFRVDGAASQNKNLTEWRNSGDTLLSSVNGEGTFKGQHVVVRQDATPNTTPEIYYLGGNGSWLTGIDVAAATPARDMTLASKIEGGSVNDIVYCAHNGQKAPVVGIGYVYPYYNYRVQVSGQDVEPSMGGVAIRVPTTSKGNPLALIDSSTGQPGAMIDQQYYHSAMKVKADPSTNRAITLARPDSGGNFGFEYADDGSFSVRYLSGGVESFRVGGDGRLRTVQPIVFTSSGAQLPYTASARPSGGLSGEIRVGAGRVWVNDAGTWKSARF